VLYSVSGDVTCESSLFTLCDRSADDVGRVTTVMYCVAIFAVVFTYLYCVLVGRVLSQVEPGSQSLYMLMFASVYYSPRRRAASGKMRTCGCGCVRRVKCGEILRKLYVDAMGIFRVRFRFRVKLRVTVGVRVGVTIYKVSMHTRLAV